VTIGVVIPCYRQERYLPRTVAALERALAGRDWSGVLVMATADHAPLPALGPRWRVLSPPVDEPLTPGAARMLGFAACGGDWVLFVDADVEIEVAWVERAIELAVREPALGGLWGRIEEWFADAGGERPGVRDLYRVGDGDHVSSYTATLSFYRRAALLAVGGYDARLNSEEDFELGLRFARAGLGLRAIAPLAARHWSAPRPSFAELGRRWSAGLCYGQGQVLRVYLGRPGFGVLLRRQTLYLGTLALWSIALATEALALARSDPRAALLGAALPLAAWGAMAARKRSARLGLHALLAWTVLGAGAAVGFFRVRRNPGAPAAAGSARC
jgi:Glycosyl transferase family 2